MITEMPEDAIVGKTKEEIENMIGKKPSFESSEESIFILKKYCFGIFTKRLYIFLHKNVVRDYYIGM